jgi:ornithine carbamoyltransferase
VDLRGRSFVNDDDFSREEMWYVLDTARDLKRRLSLRQPHELLKGKQLAMIFQKPSTRTRVSFEAGMAQLGGHAMYLGPNDLQLGRGETIRDTARVLGRYVDGIMARVFSHQDVLDLARYSGVPVINGLSDDLHPCQIASDFFTIWEKRRTLQGLTVVFIGDGNNVAHSLMLQGANMGVNVLVITPEGYRPKEQYVRRAMELAQASGSRISLSTNPADVREADVIYTDVWTSMGREHEREERLRVFGPYQVNAQLLRLARPDVLVMHCLPAHRGEEITDDVIDGPNSIVWDQAENRLHVQKALLALTMA